MQTQTESAAEIKRLQELLEKKRAIIADLGEKIVERDKRIEELQASIKSR